MVEMGQCALEKGDSPIGEWEGWPSYLRHELCTQLRAVGPVSAFLFLVSFYLLGHLPRGTVGILLALGAVALGLQSFMFGLFHGLLPLGDRVGTEMPHHLSLIPILLIAFGMGVLVTYAEPALGVVQTLGYHCAFASHEWQCSAVLAVKFAGGSKVGWHRGSGMTPREQKRTDCFVSLQETPTPHLRPTRRNAASRVWTSPDFAPSGSKNHNLALSKRSSDRCCVT